MKVLYTARATTHGGRDGSVKTDDGRLDVSLSMPKELGGAGKAGATNPEQLFAAGYAACFESAIRHVARLEKLTLEDVSVASEVSLIPAPTGFALMVALKPTITGLDQASKERLVKKAHEVCPYSNATRNNIEVKLEV